MIFALTAPMRSSSDATLLLRDVVVPWYVKFDLEVMTVVTNNSRTFLGKRYHPFVESLDVNGIDHQILEPEDFRNHGYVRYSLGMIRQALRDDTNGIGAAPLNQWITWYNTERPDKKFPNFGRTPLQLHALWLLENYDEIVATLLPFTTLVS